MPNSTFKFKHFSVKQQKSPMKIGTDSVLIGAWADSEKAKSILDIGTGTGIIALMLAQRSNAVIDAIDICPDACDQASENFYESKWSKRLNVYCKAIQDFSTDKKYDLIVSNPPYFPCPKTHREIDGAQARFTHKLQFHELADCVVRLLSPKGKFSVILPIHEGALFTNEAEQRNLFLTKFIWVKTTNKKKFPKRILMQFEFSKKDIPEESELVIENDNQYSREYRMLTKEYYLKF